MTKAQALPVAAKPAKGGKRPLKPALVFLGLVGSVSFLSIPGGILMIIGMLPTVASWISDRLPGKPFGLTVGFVNLGAVVLFLLRVVPYGHDFEQTMKVVFNIETILTIYASAFLGWGIYFGLPVVIKNHLAGKIRKKIEKIRARQQELITAWGKDVATGGDAKALTH